MKQSAAKTLGVAALGAAFAAVGAGAATAAPAVPDTAAPALDAATQTLPAENVSVLPAAKQTLETGKELAGTGLTAAEPVAKEAAKDMVAKDPTAPAKGLLGGLPLGQLPTKGLNVNGLPLGG
ncbi:ATP-binding protein [Streptomyces sp. 15-116A]|uniref:ATP-binding protein n=1 Tax=Streptomyces sp. 15-116A TaxID=2259035 RepID=UPI0021B477D8|nr:ATP-binding protein [Streptomyces sp. 15-116A]MCT7355901.1 ATP-binding protein [Streptomyces sp. 15-116A]